MGELQPLGRFEEMVLLALVRLHENAYGVTIRQEVANRSEREISIGAVYTTLDRLEAKGYISSRWGEPTAVRGGRAKRYFKIEAPGRHALRATQANLVRLIARPSYA